MSLLLTATPSSPIAAAAPQPPCPWCASALYPVDERRRALWLCCDCGITLPRT